MNNDINDAAYLISQSVSAFIQALGMIAENKEREMRGLSLAYGESAFLKVIEDQGLYSNDAINILRR